MRLSVVIIVSKNDPEGTERTLQSIQFPDADILLYDVSRKSFGEEMARTYGARYYRGAWDGYDQVRYRAALPARHDWILMLHTGEVLDRTLCETLTRLDPGTSKIAYRIRFKNRYEHGWLNHGEWGGCFHIRLANRLTLSLPERKVSEEIIRAQGIRIRGLRGHILHRVIPDHEFLQEKVCRDARCAAFRYYRKGRHVNRIRQYVSPVVSFIQHYFFKLGFLDGWKGFDCARMGARYCFMKYDLLRKLYRAAALKNNPETPEYSERPVTHFG